MSTTEAAAKLGCTPETVRKKIRDGDLSAKNVAGSWQVSIPASMLDDADMRSPVAVEITGESWLTQRVADLPVLLTVDEAAELTGFTSRQVRNMMLRRDLPSVHVGRWVRVPTADLLQLLHDATGGTAA